SGALNDIDVSKLTLTGQGGATYTLTSSNVELDSATQFTVALNATDQINVEGLLNKNGTTSVDATTYNFAAAADWNPAQTGNADATGNAITVSNVQTPTITSATYDASAGTLTVTGSNLVKTSGATNDINASKLTFTGEGGTTYSLTDSSNVEITSGTAFTITLSSTDKAAVNPIINKNGTSSTSATTYNLAASDDWNSVIGNTDISDATGNGITVSNVAAPVITSATYDASTGLLVIAGTGFLESSGTANDIDVSKFTFTGEGSTIYTLTDSADVEITSGTAFTITLSSIDKAAVNQIINKNGTSSTSGTTYNLAAAEDWAAGANSAATVADLTGNGITASNVAAPSITSATYNASSGALVVTGNNFLTASGSANDIVANKFTFTGQGGATYTLTNTPNVDITSGTAFTITLSATDKAAINPILNKNGTSSTDATTYNLAAAEDWAAGADAAVTVVDATGNGITINGAITVGNITYGPVVAQPIPTLSGPMFVVLGLLLAIIAFRALRAHSAGRPLASITAAGIFALSATSGNQLIQYAQAIMPALTFDNSTGGTLNVGVVGEHQVLNNSGQPQRVISVTATPPAIDSPTSQQPRCVAGLTVQINATCYVNFTPG
ncbi:MAG: midcut-by-XrtH protein, partial [Candidatus Nitrotoga sp.]|nr:midcut-by-XrtH protein [Candidatus Nitrotoga sp.]